MTARRGAAFHAWRRLLTRGFGPASGVVLLVSCQWISTAATAAQAPAAASPPPPQEEVWLGSSWSRCDLSELAATYFRAENPQCPVPGRPGRRLLRDVACQDIEWQGVAYGGGLGCSTTCTCFHSGHSVPGICDVGVCPGDVVCREGYRFLGLAGGKAFVEAPRESNNCWRAVMGRRETRPRSAIR